MLFTTALLKNWLLNKWDDIKYKKVKCFAKSFVAAHFDQFLAIWSEYGLVDTSYNNDPHNRVFMLTDFRKRFWRLTSV